MKRTVIKMVMAAVGVATFALAPAAFAGDKHRIPLPHEVLGLPPPPHIAILGALHGHRGHANHNHRYDHRHDRRHDRRHSRYHNRHDWRDDRRGHRGRYDRHDRRHENRGDRGRGGRHRR
jgi:hypothetical protein